MINYFRKGQRLVLTYKSANSHFWEEHWENHYEETSIEQTTHLFKTKPLFKLLMSYFSNQAKDKTIRILEAGCGPGAWVKLLSDEKLFVTGVDFALSALKTAKMQWEHLPLACCDIKKLPFPDETFDSVLSFGVVEHFVEGPEKALEEAYRVLKPQGFLFVSVPYFSPFRKLKSIAYFYDKGKPDFENFHAYYFTKDEFKAILQDCGFTVQKIYIMEGTSGLKAEFSFLKNLHLSAAGEMKNDIKNHQGKISFKSLLKYVSEIFLVRILFGHMILFIVRK